MFLDKLMKDETSVDGAGASTVTPAKLRMHTLYKGNTSYTYVFDESEAESRADTFFNKYQFIKA